VIGAGVRVEVLDILVHHDVKVAWSGDQEIVEAFGAGCR